MGLPDKKTVCGNYSDKKRQWRAEGCWGRARTGNIHVNGEWWLKKLKNTHSCDWLTESKTLVYVTCPRRLIVWKRNMTSLY